MQIHFVAASAEPTLEAFTGYLLERRRYARYPHGLRYENPETGAFFDVEVGAAGETLPFYLEYPASLPAAFGDEIANELQAIVERFDLAVVTGEAGSVPLRFVRARFLAQHAARYQRYLEEAVRDGMHDLPRLPAHVIAGAATFNGQLAVCRAAIWADQPGATVPAIFCVADPSRPSGLATAVEWDGQTAILPAVDYVFAVGRTDAGMVRRAIPREILTLPLTERSASTSYCVNGPVFEAGFPHFVLGAAHRMRFDALLARESGPSLVTFPWWRVADGDALAALVIAEALVRAGRGDVDPTFELAWGDATTLGADGSVREGTSTIGHATLDEISRLAKALGRAGFVRSEDGSVLLDTCEVRAGTHAALVDLDANTPDGRVSDLLAALRAETFGASPSRGSIVPRVA